MITIFPLTLRTNRVLSINGLKNTEKLMGSFLLIKVLIVILFNYFNVSYYEGHVPTLVTSDLEIIQEVFIKQFNNFSARKVSLT